MLQHEISWHVSGALITADTVGKILFDHYEASKGRLVPFSIEEVGVQVVYRALDGNKQGSFSLEQGRNWLAVTYQTAKQEIQAFHAGKIKEAEQALQKAQEDRGTMEKELAAAEEDFAENVVRE